MLGDGPDPLAQLVKGRQVDLERGFGADLFGLGALDNRPVIDAAGQPVQRRADGAAEDVGGLGIGERRQRAHGLDAQPVQLLFGYRPDSPQLADR